MKTFRSFLCEEKRSFSKEEAKKIGDSLKIDWDEIDLEQFRKGLGVESEHDDESDTDVVNSDKDLGKIALAHLRELPDYYTKLAKMEK